MYNLSQNLAGKAFEFSIAILISLMWNRIPPSPDNFKRDTETRLSKLPFIVTLNQWQILYSRLRQILDRDLFKVIKL